MSSSSRSPVEVFAPAARRTRCRHLRRRPAHDAGAAGGACNGRRTVRDVSRIAQRCLPDAALVAYNARRQTSTNRTFAISGTCCRRVGSFGRSGRGTRTGCFGGRRCPSPISSSEWFESDLLRATVAAPGFRARCSARDRPVPRSSFCSGKLRECSPVACRAGAWRPRRFDDRRWPQRRAAAGAKIQTGAPVERIIVEATAAWPP